MLRFEDCLPEIYAAPQDWIAPIVRSGYRELVLKLLHKKPDLLQYRGARNHNLLQEAAFSGHHEIADALMALGVPLDIVSAVALDRIAIVRSIVESDGSLLQKRSPRELSLLHIACRNASPELTRLLIASGADVNDHKNSKRIVPLFLSTIANADELLGAGADIDWRAKHRFTALHQAARYGNLEMTRFLIKRGARTDLQTDGRQTAWALAVRNKQTAVAELLRS